MSDGPDIVEKELWDHYSELPNPSWYDYKNKEEEKLKDNNKYPDNVVYNYETKEFDAKIKAYPTSVGASKFEPIKVDKSDSIKANKYFESRLDELKGEYKRLVEEYNWTSLVYKSNYNFQPILGEPYHLYEKENKTLFLSLIGPSDWNELYIGTFKLLNNGKWEKI
jgi:hypothetical protein|tara:strand:- start:840 stop:1337 length:498 start_codon:yes stop_codon:yes gene_type:complete